MRSSLGEFALENVTQQHDLGFQQNRSLSLEDEPVRVDSGLFAPDAEDQVLLFLRTALEFDFDCGGLLA